MKKWLHLVFASTLFLFWSCAPEEEIESGVYDVIGEWSCKEEVGAFAPQIYPVEIIEDVNASGNGVIIKGLYNLGDQFRVVGSYDQMKMIIPVQTSGSFQIQGNGDIRTDWDHIDLNFAIDDGSGVDQVEAVLTRK